MYLFLLCTKGRQEIMRLRDELYKRSVFSIALNMINDRPL